MIASFTGIAFTGAIAVLLPIFQSEPRQFAATPRSRVVLLKTLATPGAVPAGRPGVTPSAWTRWMARVNGCANGAVMPAPTPAATAAPNKLKMKSRPLSPPSALGGVRSFLIAAVSACRGHKQKKGSEW